MNLFRLIFAAALLSWAPFSVAEQVVNVYSARHYDTDMALYERFTEETGITVNLIEGGSDALIERIINEGKFSPADMMITVDAGRLWRAAQKDIFQPVESSTLSQRIPEHLRHPSGLWFGLSKRARVIVYNKDRDLAKTVSDYEDLTQPALKGQVCMRSSGNIYNLSLLASIIEANGAEAAQTWANGLVANFARKPQSNDTGQLRAVAAGECGITVANTYYLGRILGSAKAADRAVAENLGVLFPNQDGRGSHVNISGAGITKYAPNKPMQSASNTSLATMHRSYLPKATTNIRGWRHRARSGTGNIQRRSNVGVSIGRTPGEAVKIFDRAGWL